ncbi:hypothetical protein JI435_413360 [Parastagonospora nodorum SN15]|uniref:Uncharacterized protein n=1 Tax=Phaeosphaeria nodorum (strain SN15 / ATCC MYA-4574 / FGSC 10173) TaxID=321614 RepID=A0A7U2FAG1_PHANO|nr:hypothetical protein JI435_413360 [Parastagonospora nodorum SN15]
MLVAATLEGSNIVTREIEVVLCARKGKERSATQVALFACWRLEFRTLWLRVMVSRDGMQAGGG